MTVSVNKLTEIEASSCHVKSGKFPKASEKG